jgi:6-phosphogluconolactonase
MQPKVEILADQTALIQRSLELMVEKIQQSVRERGICTIALSGGSTPRPLYEAIAAQNLPWEKIHIFWGDERYVPSHHPDSNEKLARDAWLNRVAIPAENIHPTPTDSGNPQQDAQRYEQQLQQFFQLSPGTMPVLDIMLQGMGDDGHTASLFPHTEALQVCDRAIAVGNKDGSPRITFTIPAINNARCVLFLVAGSGKQNAIEQVFSQTADPQTYPAKFIQPQGELWWLLDVAAGAPLQS